VTGVIVVIIGCANLYGDYTTKNRFALMGDHGSDSIEIDMNEGTRWVNLADPDSPLSPDDIFLRNAPLTQLAKEKGGVGVLWGLGQHGKLENERFSIAIHVLYSPPPSSLRASPDDYGDEVSRQGLRGRTVRRAPRATAFTNQTLKPEFASPVQKFWNIFREGNRIPDHVGGFFSSFSSFAFLSSIGKF
jgi:hypothetical protein